MNVEVNGCFHTRLERISKIIQGVPGGNFNILGGHIIGHPKQKCVYVHVSYSERFLRYSYFTVELDESPPPVPTLAKSIHSSAAHHIFDRRSFFPSWSG